MVFQKEREDLRKMFFAFLIMCDQSIWLTEQNFIISGLTWVFGVIQVSSPHIVLEYLFAITNTLQV